MSKHTLGDWEASGQLIVTAALHGHPNPKAQRSPKIIGEVHWNYDGDQGAKEPRTEWHEAEANQRLMIAAPDLLEAVLRLKQYVKVLHQQWEEDGKPLNTKLHGLAVCLNNRPGDMIDAAIAKATGETV